MLNVKRKSVIIIALLLMGLLTGAHSVSYAQDFEFGYGYFAKHKTADSLNAYCTAINSGTIAAGCYKTIAHTTNLTIREGINIGQQYRIRQSGTLKAVTLYCATKTGMTSIQIRVWRKNGSTYTRIGTSNNIYSSLTAGADNTVTLSTPITGCLEGDYYSLVYDATTSPLQGVADANCTLYYINGASDSLNYAWGSQSSVAYGIPVTLYMSPPNMVFIGDSQISGATSLLETTLASTFSATLSYKVATPLNYTVQNMGIGGNSTTQILARYQADAIDLLPRIIVLNGGINDIAGNVATSTIISNLRSMVETAAGNRITICVFLLPWSNGTQAQTRQWDSVYTQDSAMVVQQGGYWIATKTTFGVFSDSGYAGNLSKLNPIYTSDGTHLNDAGNTLLASLITAKIQSAGCYAPQVTPTIPVDTNGLNLYFTSDNASGTITSWQNLKDTTQFRQATSANKPVKSTGVLFDTTDVLKCNIPTQSTSLTAEFIVKFTDTNAYANQTMFGARYTSPTLTVLCASLVKNSTSGAAKFVVSYYAGGGYYDKNYSVAGLLNKFVLVTVAADSSGRVSVYFNGTLQTSLSTAVNTSYNGNGIFQIGETTAGLKNVQFRMISYWRTKLSAGTISTHYTTYNSLGLIDP